MASLLLGSPNSLPGSGQDGPAKKKKIPKVAVYVAGAAFAITTGLTLLVIPYVRQAAKLSNPTQFMSHRSLAHLNARPLILTPQPAPASQPPSSSLAATTLSPYPAVGETTSELADTDAALLAARSFNASEEKSLYGSSLSPGEGEDGANAPVSGLLGLKALGIATAMVFGSAGLGALIVAKLVGVDNMTDFSAKMRESLNLSMPGLVGRVNVPGRSADGFDGEAIEQWVAKIEADDEAEERLAQTQAQERGEVGVQPS